MMENEVFGECHAHLLMDGMNYREAVQLHKNGVCVPQVRDHLRAYQSHGITFVRDGGDALHVSETAKKLAGEYGIDYRSPMFAIHKKGHYGKIVGKGFETMHEYAELVQEVRDLGGDFIKIMVSGIMVYEEVGCISSEPLTEQEIREMIHIAHEEGFAVMVHVNGADPVRAAVCAGADSIEHGNYLDRDGIAALAQSDCVWVPTIVTTGNLIGCGRYPEENLQRIFEMEKENLHAGFEAGVKIAVGSDAGAFLVPHAEGTEEELRLIKEALKGHEKVTEHLRKGEKLIRQKFRQ
ncbi:MAG: amidohydrolase family protein [Eubacteriales bacterium]|nr:amidohydrolase family protein [Eubacteriales bacterium]